MPHLYVFHYSDATSSLGTHDVCFKDCARPCPCSVPVGPQAFDVDAQGRAWIIDHAKGRVAAFDRRGRFLFDVTAPGNDYRNVDVQIVDGRPVVLRYEGTGFFFTIEGRRAGPLKELYVGDTRMPIVAQPFVVSQDRIIFQPGLEGNMDPVEIDLSGDGRRAVGERVPGIPYRDGWLLWPEFISWRTHAFEMRTPEDSRRVEITYRLQGRRNGQIRRAGGVVSYEREVARDGTIHLLLFAGAAGWLQKSAYFYIWISPDGTVAEPVRLAYPDPPGVRRYSATVPYRRLSLAPDDQPLIMWAGPERTVIVPAPYSG
jgi:hypothetical protein